MKKKQWLKAFGGVDDKYVHESAPSGAARARSGKTVRLISILAACMAFVMLCGTFALFIPFRSTPPSVAAYAGSPYYGIIQKFNEYNYTPPSYKNTADLLWHLPGELIDGLFAKAEDFAPSNPESADPGNANGNYREVTDNQVSGVIEADLIKRSDTHVYYLYYPMLLVYSIEKEDSKLVGSYDLSPLNVLSYGNCEFFLSADCRTVTVILPYLNKGTEHYSEAVRIVTLDVSDPARGIRLASSVDISGSYLSSRLTEHGMLIMTNMRCYDPDYSDESTFVPQIKTTEGQAQSIPADSIVSPETLSNATYTVLVLMDDEGATVKDSAAYLSYSQDVYVSKSAIYATRQYNEYGQTRNGETPYHIVSEICCIGYGADGFEKRGSVIVDGSVLDQYSMDEYQNTLRVVTTTSEGVQRERTNAWGGVSMEMTTVSPFNGNTSASLYVLDLDTMQIIASVEQFAPKGETVRSARFDGNMAYVCTAIQQTDPVFFFDLSDLDSIEVKETGTIAGFSTSLVNFADGYLLGIGRGGNGNELKIEIYTEGENSVESFAKYELPCTDYAPDYKCYYIDRENGLIGLGIYTWDKVYLDTSVYKYDNYRYGYIVLHFDGESIREVLRYEYGSSESIDEMRGVYIDGYYYVFNGTRIDVGALELD